MHDQHQLSVVYETLQFEPNALPHDRQPKVDAERSRLQEILRRLATGALPANAEEERIRELWGENGTPARLAEAANDVRFQLGQADRFRAGLERAGTWQQATAELFAAQGLPPELALLPHVESSFDPAAYSKAGAAGMWQFIRSTGRLYLRIDSAVDERLDPFRETEAAAQLLNRNFQLLGTWPLAITAYNHGAEGMRRARDQMGTDDIVRIVRDYHSPTFGFASRNYYVSFLAAVSIAQNPSRYFGQLSLGVPLDFHEIRMTTNASAQVLEQTLKIDEPSLRTLNPALRPPVWEGELPVPAGYVLRLPAADATWTSEQLAQQLPSQAASKVASTRSRTRSRSARRLHAAYPTAAPGGRVPHSASL